MTRLSIVPIPIDPAPQPCVNGQWTVRGCYLDPSYPKRRIADIVDMFDIDLPREDDPRNVYDLASAAWEDGAQGAGHWLEARYRHLCEVELIDLLNRCTDDHHEWYWHDHALYLGQKGRP